MLVSKNISLAWKLIISLLVCESVGFISGLLSVTDLNAWFNTINKPSWNPVYLFGPVWTCLYLLMGVSFWMIWKSHATYTIKRNAEIIFMIQLFLNFCWSILFFRFQSPLLALIDIIFMIIAILITIIYFTRISKLASGLLVPYLLWVCFAAAINYAIWNMNV